MWHIVTGFWCLLLSPLWDFVLISNFCSKHSRALKDKIDLVYCLEPKNDKHKIFKQVQLVFLKFGTVDGSVVKSSCSFCRRAELVFSIHVRQLTTTCNSSLLL